MNLLHRLALFFVNCKRLEGRELMPYLCPAGIWTCGYGSTGADVIPGVAWSEEYAEARLQRDGIKFALAVLKACPTLAIEPDARLSAVTLWTYNLGEGRLLASTMRKRINERQWHAAAIEMRKWVYAAGKVLRGLVLRRALESTMLEFPPVGG